MKQLLFAFVLFCLTLAGCGGNNSHVKKSGESIRIKQECFSATTEKAFDELNKNCVRKDESAIERQISKGEVYILPNYTTGKLVEYKFAKSLLRTNSGLEVWVSNECWE